MPETGSGTEPQVVAWLRHPGEWVESAEALLVVAWDGLMAHVEAPAAGVLQTICVGTGEAAATGVSLALIGVAVAEPDPAPIEVSAPEPPPPPQRDLRLFLSPAVRRVAAERGIDPYELEGSGRDGRVTLADVLAR